MTLQKSKYFNYLVTDSLAQYKFKDKKLQNQFKFKNQITTDTKLLTTTIFHEPNCMSFDYSNTNLLT